MKTAITLFASAFLAGISVVSAAGEKVKPYPRDICIVTDNKLGSMGRPIAKVYGSQEVKFCCKPCVKKFEKNPSKYLAKL
jgi:hypothetical protein